MTGSRRESSARQTLQEFYEQLNRKWQEAEHLLLALDVPTPVSVRIKTVEPEFPGARRCHHELGFIRHYGRWGLCYGVSADGDPRDRFWTSIHRCCIEQRVEATRAFPALRDRMLEEAERYTHTVEKALAALTRSLEPGDTRSALPEPAPSDPIPESIDLLPDEEGLAGEGISDDIAEEIESSYALVPNPVESTPSSAGDDLEGKAESHRPHGDPNAADLAGTSDAGNERDATPLIPTPLQFPALPIAIQRWESEGGEPGREAA